MCACVCATVFDDDKERPGLIKHTNDNNNNKRKSSKKKTRERKEARTVVHIINRNQRSSQPYQQQQKDEGEGTVTALHGGQIRDSPEVHRKAVVEPAADGGSGSRQ